MMKFALVLFLVGTSSFALVGIGKKGKDGERGYDGKRGVSGPSVMIRAEGPAQNFDLRGGDGGPGTVGYDGASATECNQLLGESDELGAPGGSAGRGGTGGYGGNGGSAWVQYDDSKNLKTIFIDATPGKGGPGGLSGANAGKGCRCSQPSWRKGGKTYICTDGKDGYSNQPPVKGTDGYVGTVQLIPHLNEVKAEKTVMRFPMSQILNGPFTFRKHQWRT